MMQVAAFVLTAIGGALISGIWFYRAGWLDGYDTAMSVALPPVDDDEEDADVPRL